MEENEWQIVRIGKGTRRSLIWDFTHIQMEALGQIDDSETDSEMDAYDTDSDIVDDTDAEDQNETADMDTDMDWTNESKIF